MNSTAVAITQFDWAEYSIFSIMIGLSALIGIYFGCYKGGQDTISGYLLGGKDMDTIPVAASLIASYISGVTLLGVPTEIYTYGTQFFLANVTNIFVGTMTAVLFLPVFYKLQLISLYEYLEMRFSYKVRIIASLLNALSLITFIPIVIYGPALAFNQVSGVNIHLMTSILCTVCIFYTTLGGLKAVVWTDTIQGFLMLCSVVIVTFLGLQKVGGFGKMVEMAKAGDRVDFFVMDPDPTLRLSFWSVTFGLLFTWTAQLAVNPGVVQRFISLPTYRRAQLSIIYMTIGVVIFASLSMTTGLIMYAAYASCDPLSAKIIARPDQILPHFVLDVAGHIPGLPGLFIAGLVSAALSTMSTSLNTIAGTVFEDFISPYLSPKIRDEHAASIMRAIVVTTGVICTLMVFVIENLGQILEMASSFGGVTTGTSLGIFSLGLLFPWANTKGAVTGGLTSIALMSWILIGNQIAIGKGLINYPTKPMRTDGCSALGIDTIPLLNSTITPPMNYDNDVFFLYKISVFHYGLIGCLTVLIVGIPVSLLTRKKGDEGKIHPDLISPLIHRFVTLQQEPANLPLNTTTRSPPISL